MLEVPSKIPAATIDMRPPSTCPPLADRSSSLLMYVLHVVHEGELTALIGWESVVAIAQSTLRTTYVAKSSAPVTSSANDAALLTGGFSPGLTPGPVVNGPVRVGEGDALA